LLAQSALLGRLGKELARLRLLVLLVLSGLLAKGRQEQMELLVLSGQLVERQLVRQLEILLGKHWALQLEKLLGYSTSW
jgi:hypothetical protein